MTTFHYCDCFGLDYVLNASQQVHRFVCVRVLAPHYFARQINVDGVDVVHHVNLIIMMNANVIVDPNKDLLKKKKQQYQ